MKYSVTQEDKMDAEEDEDNETDGKLFKRNHNEGDDIYLSHNRNYNYYNQNVIIEEII